MAVDTNFLIDHMRRKLPMSDKIGEAIIAELQRVKALEDELRRAKYEKSIMDSAAIEDNEAYIQRLEGAIKSLLSQDISEQYLNMVRKNTTAEELLEEERDSLRSKVKALEEALLLVQVLLIHIAAKGHKSGYDWNSYHEKLTLTEGEIHERINKALEATCTNTPKG